MAPATGSITGRVIDAAGNSVPGATVAVASGTQPHRDIGAIASGDGAFRMGGMRPGSYVIEARSGTATGSARVQIAHGQATIVEIRVE